MRELASLIATSMILSAADTASIRLMVVDPGHFHAALIQREMYPGISSRVSVFAPLGPELVDYLTRVSLFNNRKEDPTKWELDVHAGGDSMERMLKEHPGNVAVFTGKNRSKIGRIGAALAAGINVFADKPWIISSADLDKLEQALTLADKRRLIAYDIMTERYEITSVLQRELVNDAAIFGKLDTGSLSNPAVRARSIHHVIKTVAGVPLRRPVWFFDVEEYGEGLADVGTHVVDLIQWIVLPDQEINYKKDVQIVEGRRWPLVLDSAQFKQVTGESEIPDSLRAYVRNGKFEYMCNNSVGYTLRGSHVKLDILWNAEAPHGDIYEASFRGSKATVSLRQGEAEKYRPELYVSPMSEAVKKKIAALQATWPGLSTEEKNGEAHILIPEKFRVGHEAHFAQVANQFFVYLRSPELFPRWERSYMLAKYYVSTRGVDAAKK